MRRMNGLMMWAVGGMLLAGAFGAEDVWAGKKDEHKEKLEMAGVAKVTIDQAIKTATETVQGKVIEAELEKEHGKIIWEVEVVTADGKVMAVHIDADAGTVIDTEDKGAEKGKKEKHGKK